PDTKELQSIVDYTRSPATTSSAAINPMFNCTQITNEGGVADYPWYWSSTTFSSQAQTNGASATYVCFGRAMGYFPGLGWTDIHGAGCQRSDPKPRSFAGYTHNGNGYYNPNAPQGDAVRIYNYVRLVRNGSSTGINENKDNHLFNVYPNPVSDELTIEMKVTGEIASFELLNSIGQIVQNGSLIEKIVINTNDLVPGIYLLKLQNGNTFEVKKLIKE
ncbi:MAG: T9SS type A sorting domain-containing protein, partial [Bacteroidota bacterium]